MGHKIKNQDPLDQYLYKLACIYKYYNRYQVIIRNFVFFFNLKPSFFNLNKKNTSHNFMCYLVNSFFKVNKNITFFFINTNVLFSIICDTFFYV